MANIIIKVLKKINTRLINKSFTSFEEKRNYLINKGAKIGKDTRILSDISSFGSEPYLVEIGSNCLLSYGIHFITHDGGISVLNNLNYFPKRADKLGKIKIGNNVFIGINTTIMPNVNIGENVIIGAGSIVTKDIPNNSVVCGVPAKIIMSIDEYYEKLKDNVHYTAGMKVEEKRKYCQSI